MPLSRRYRPEWFPGDQSLIGMDFSPLIPPGVGIQAASLAIETNTVPPNASTDFTAGTPSVEGRTVYAQLSGGVEGTDYQLIWIVTDTQGNIWRRGSLLLCARTS
jgi:hypothetical protein